jgi:hypothetical protein
MHIHKSRFLVRGEVWYDSERSEIQVDWVLYRQRSQPVPGTKWKFFYSNLVDLIPSPEVLLSAMSTSNAYQIRRARDKDRITCECPQSVGRELLDSFTEIYKRFAAITRLPPLDRPFLDQLANDGCLEVSVAKDLSGVPLVYHVYYCGPNRCCLLHTVSLYQALSDKAARNAMGRANRYLFWSDMLRNRERGLKVFDFGGWYPGKTDPDLLDINRFKEGFGGRIVREYNCEEIVSLKARVILSVASLLNRVNVHAVKVCARRRTCKTEVPATEMENSPGATLARTDTSVLRESELAN